jgi:hypothetical protein
VGVGRGLDACPRDAVDVEATVCFFLGGEVACLTSSSSSLESNILFDLRFNVGLGGASLSRFTLSGALLIRLRRYEIDRYRPYRAGFFEGEGGLLSVNWCSDNVTWSIHTPHLHL